MKNYLDLLAYSILRHKREGGNPFFPPRVGCAVGATWATLPGVWLLIKGIKVFLPYSFLHIVNVLIFLLSVYLFYYYILRSYKYLSTCFDGVGLKMYESHFYGVMIFFGWIQFGIIYLVRDWFFE